MARKKSVTIVPERAPTSVATFEDLLLTEHGLSPQVLNFLRILDMKQEVCLQKTFDTEKVVKSLDEEVFQNSEANDALRTKLKGDFYNESNVMTKEIYEGYQVAEGLYNRDPYMTVDHNQFNPQHSSRYLVQFKNPNQAECFRRSLHMLRALIPNLEELDLWDFLQDYNARY